MPGWRRFCQRWWSSRSYKGVCRDELYGTARADVQLAGIDGELGRRASKLEWRSGDDQSAFGRGVTAETVSKLCREGYLQEAVEALGVLVQTDCCISNHLLYTVLKKCVDEKDLVLGRRVHVLTVKKGFQSDTFLSTHIVRMYASHGKLQDAMDVFQMVGKPDGFMWCAIISAHVKHGQDHAAIDLYHRMRRSNVKADGHVFAAALQACARGSDLKTGQQVHADVLANGVESDVFVCSCLVDMYVKCGSLHRAQLLFDGLVHKNVVTWNTILAGYSQQGKGLEALRLYGAMQDEGMVAPDSVTFVCLLQACASVGTPALEKGKELHAQVRERGYETDLFVANSLVSMYAKCGSLQEARNVFDELGQKDVVTWNAMTAAYSQQGMGLKALDLYTVMQETGITLPNSVTFVCLLQACASLGSSALETGKALHIDIRKRGHENDGFVANSLVDMYAKCGSLSAAQRVFDTLGHKDVVSWNTLITGYSHSGMGQEALNLYRAMQEEGTVVPNSVTFVCLLQACATVGRPALEKGKQLHVQIRKQGYQGDVFVTNSLVNMYAKCGSLKDAQRVFDELDQKDVVTWTALIAGYSQQGMGREALCLYGAMQEEGIALPNCVTFACLLQACASVGSAALGIGQKLHAQIRERGYQADSFVGSSLVNMYAKCGSLEDAESAFALLGEQDVVAWTALIAGYSQQGRGQEALHLYNIMQEKCIGVPNCVTFVCLLQACASVGNPALAKGKELHVQIRERGHEADVSVANSLINMYAKCGSLEDARRLFDDLGERDVVTWTVLIAAYSQQGMGQEALFLHSGMQAEGIAVPNSVTFVCLLQACASIGAPALETGKHIHEHIRELGHQADVFVSNSLVNMYAKCGSLEDAQSVFDGLGHKDVVAWTALIAGYSEQGMGQEALRRYNAMQEDGVTVPDAVTFVCLLQACANVAALHMGRRLHAQIEEGGLQADFSVATSLINMYGKCGSMVDAQQVFDALPEKNDVAWSALIAGYTCQGHIDVVFDLVHMMKEDGIQPVGITFLSLLTACSHAGLVNKGKEYFETMSTQYGITPTVEHYTCMVDLLGRAGLPKEALSLIRRMPASPNAAVWHTLLGACQKWNDVQVGRHAFREAMNLDKKDAAAYVLMSNIYTGARMWEQAQKVQEMRKRVRARKPRGRSCWTDMEGQVHNFFVGSDQHPRVNRRKGSCKFGSLPGLAKGEAASWFKEEDMTVTLFVAIALAVRKAFTAEETDTRGPRH